MAVQRFTAHIAGTIEGKLYAKKPGEPVVYVIQHLKTKLIKIGITNNLRKRCASLKVGTGCAFLAAVQISQNLQCEQQLHSEFSEWRIPGTEWFHLTPFQIEILVRKVCSLGSQAVDSSSLQASTKQLLEAANAKSNEQQRQAKKAKREMQESLILSLEPLHKCLADAWLYSIDSDNRVTFDLKTWEEIEENLQRGVAGVASIFANHTWETL